MFANLDLFLSSYFVFLTKIQFTLTAKILNIYGILDFSFERHLPHEDDTRNECFDISEEERMSSEHSSSSDALDNTQKKNSSRSNHFLENQFILSTGNGKELQTNSNEEGAFSANAFKNSFLSNGKSKKQRRNSMFIFF